MIFWLIVAMIALFCYFWTEDKELKRFVKNVRNGAYKEDYNWEWEV